MKTTFFLLLITISTFLFSQGTYQPICYWTFNQSDFKTDSLNSKGLKISGKLNRIKGVSGKGIELAGELQNLNDQHAFFEKATQKKEKLTYETWFIHRITPQNYGLVLIAENEAFRLQFYNNWIYFSTYTEGGTNKNKSAQVLRIPLYGSDRASFQYYLDKQWHHLVATFDAKTGKKEVWIDGECPNSFQIQHDSLKKPLFYEGKQPLRLDGANSQRPNVFSYDEIAIYDKVLPPSLIRKHYTEGLKGKPYSFKDDSKVTMRALPLAYDDTAKLDIYDFVPENAELTPLKQLSTYPLPRYKPHHTLQRNFNWADIYFLSGSADGTKRDIKEANQLAINYELAKNWYYYLTLSMNTKMREEETFIKQANDNPWFPIAVTSFWIQTVPQALYPEKSKKAYVLGKNSKLANKQWNPVMNLDSVRADGRTQNFYLKKRLDKLTRPINLINDNGEVFTYIHHDEDLEKYPEVVADKQRIMPNKSWYEYQSYKVYYLDSTYKYEMMKDPRLKNTKFTVYQIEGEHKQWRFSYDYRKKINDKMRGYYYSTMDIYPVYHSKWYEGSGAWHGWAWVGDCRRVEIEKGDKLFSPFVAAGWKSDETRNLRPGRWLGMLKAMSLAGAEFFYTGFFNEKAPFPLPKNYAWQLSTPVYAQAISSYYQDVLFKGEILEGDVTSMLTKNLMYHFWTGNPQHLVVVRKYQNKYVITGSIQPYSITPGNVPKKDTVTIQLEGQPITFEIRQQGSTYIYDNSNPKQPVFYQLDTWHEATHPSWWSKSFYFQAEVIDTCIGKVEIITERKSDNLRDFSGFTSYVLANNKLGYRFQTRDIPEHKQLKLKIRARLKEGNTATLTAQLDKNATNYQQPNQYTGTSFQTNTLTIKGKEWKWYEIDSKNQPILYENLPFEEAAMLWLKADNGKVEIDDVIIEAK
ncbi:MAG: hypothetical protein ACKVTZ_08830 [Bacteroidia bacterium]